MNNAWQGKYSRNRDTKNTVAIYETQIQDVAIQAHIYVTPQVDGLSIQRTIYALIYYVTKSEHFVESYFHEVSDDIFELAQQAVGTNEVLPNISFNEYFLVDKLNNNIPFTFGDYIKENDR